MPSVGNSPTLNAWIRENTSDASCVVDFGAGFFDKLRNVPPMVKKIGIEVFPAYLAYAPVGVKAVCGDMREWERFVSPQNRDTAMLIDTIEHLPKADGVELLRQLKEHFRCVLVMTPDGFHEQTEDLTGYENEWQRHECGYTADELRGMGFTVSVIEGFHEAKGNALFAVWRRE